VVTGTNINDLKQLPVKLFQPTVDGGSSQTTTERTSEQLVPGEIEMTLMGLKSQ